MERQLIAYTTLKKALVATFALTLALEIRDETRPGIE
jgi:hypothetical protein